MLKLNMNTDAKTEPSDADIQLRFRCLGCGNCCRGDGHVFLDANDIHRLTAFFGLTPQEFLRRYTKTTSSGDVALKDRDDACKSCILLEGDHCVAHEAKPVQCRDFPFQWRSQAMENFCEGWRAMTGLLPLPGKGRQRNAF